MRPTRSTRSTRSIRPSRRWLAVAALAVALTACAGDAATDELAPVRAPLERAIVDEPVTPTADHDAASSEAPQGSDDATAVTGDRASTPPDDEAPPPTPPVSRPVPDPVPEVSVDADGCATDPVTGLIVACADPAAGPDPGSEEHCRATPADPSCEPR